MRPEIGDHKQLRPVVNHPANGANNLNISLFERLADTGNCLLTKLREQHRMPSAIAAFPSKQYYMIFTSWCEARVCAQRRRLNSWTSSKESPSSATCHIERWSFVALECFRISISFAARGRAQCSQLLPVFLLMQLLLLVVTVLLLLIIYYLWSASLYSVATSCHIEWRL